VREGTYRIDSQPNLNQMLVTRVDAVRQELDTVRQRVRQAVDEVVGQRPFPARAIWPEGPGHVHNRQTLTLVVLDTEHTWGPAERQQAKARAFIEEILGSARNTFRQFKNVLVFAVATADGVRIVEDTAVRLLALEAIHRQYRSGGLSETQMDELEMQLDRARKGLPGAVWGAYTVTVAPNGSAGGETSLWVRQEHGFAGYRAWERLVDEQRLLERIDPRLVAEGKGDQWRLWPAEDDRINVDTLWGYFCRFPYLPMLTGPEALQQTVTWGVQRGLFAYALGDGETFDTIYYRESLPSATFAIIEGAWLLRPALAEALVQPEVEEEDELLPRAPVEAEEEEGVAPTPAPHSPTGPAPQPPPAVYHRVVIDTPVDWRQWYDFYQAVIQPLVESGAEVRLEVHLTAEGELDANLVDLSVKESVVQLDRRGRVEVEE